MSDNTEPAVGSNAELGPLPERTLAEVVNDYAGELKLSETGVLHYGSHWRVKRHLYTADDVRTFGLKERAAERERWDELLSGARRIAERNAKRADDCGMLSRALIDALSVLRA